MNILSHSLQRNSPSTLFAPAPPLVARPPPLLLAEVGAAEEVEEREVGAVLAQLIQSDVLDGGAQAEADVDEAGAG